MHIQPFRILLLTTAIALLFSTLALAQSFQAKVVRVLDGDTVEVLHNGKAERIRLHGIDAPEKGQAFGNKAKQFVLDIAAQKMVTVEVRDTDRYGRTVGEVFLPGGRSLNREIIKAGYAWWYKKYSNDASLGQLEAEAREAGRGLWRDKNPVPPWEWRRGKKAAREQAREYSVAPSAFRCGVKKFCGDMSSCEEATFYLKACGLTRLDGDGDGVPCEAICRSEEHKGIL